jgi:fatty acid amide hydrolase
MGRYSVPIGQRVIPSQVGLLARHVEDVALGLEVINGGRNPDVEPPIPLGDYRDVDIRSLRVAWYTDDGTFAVAPAISRAVREAADRLRDAGASVTAWTPPGVPDALQLFYGIFIADGGRLLRAMLGREKRAPQVAQLLALARLPRWLIRSAQGLLHAVGEHTMASNMAAFGRDDTAHYWKLVEMVLEYRERFRERLDRDAGGPFDLILAPPCALPAFTHGATRDLLTAGAYASLYNVLGYPAGVVPATRVREDEESERPASRDRIVGITRHVEEASAGLPVGVQVIARPWREHVALAAMHAIERSARMEPDFPRTPVMISE